MEELYNLLLQIIANSPTGQQLPTLEALEPDQSILVFKPGEKRPYLIRKDKIVFVGEPITTLKGLSDTPDSYAGQKGKILVVKQDETGFEYKVLAEVTGVTEQQLNDAVAALEAQIAASSPTTTGELVLNPNWQGTGYEYYPWASWRKDGVQFTDTRPITADPAHATLDRIDLWLLNLITGLIELLKGTPAENPVEPTYDPTTHLKGPILLVKAASLTPEGVSGETIYDGEGAGWTLTAGNSFNTQSQNGDPFGTYCIETIDALPKDVAILFGRSTPLAYSEGMEIPYKIKNIVGKAHRFLISGTKPNSGKSISAWVEMPAAYSLTSVAWQYLSITVPPGFATVSNVWLMTSEAGMMYYLDDVRIVSGAGAVPSGGVTYEDFNALEERVTELENNPSGGAAVEDQIVDGVVDKAPSQNAVFDAIATLEGADDDLALQIDEVEEDVINHEARIAALENGGSPTPGGGFGNIDFGLTGAIDGVNKVFQTSAAFTAGKVLIFLNGIAQTLGDDYTESTTQIIEFIEAPHVGDKLIAVY